MTTDAAPARYPLGRPARWVARAPDKGWVDLARAAQAMGCDLVSVVGALQARGMADASGHPTPAARRAEMARWMDRARGSAQYLWRMDDVARAVNASRSRGGAEMASGPGFSTLQRIGARFGRSAVATGRELKRLGWRQANGLPTTAALLRGLAQARMTRHGRVATLWQACKVSELLAQAGWQDGGDHGDAGTNPHAS